VCVCVCLVCVCVCVCVCLVCVCRQNETKKNEIMRQCDQKDQFYPHTLYGSIIFSLYNFFSQTFSTLLIAQRPSPWHTYSGSPGDKESTPLPMPRTPDFSFAGSKKRNIGVVFSILMSVMGVSMLQETKFDPLRIALKVWAICSKYSGFSAILASILRMRSTLGSRNKNALPPPPFMPSPTITAAQAPLLSRRARKIKSQIKSNKDASASKKVPLKDLYGVVVDSR